MISSSISEFIVYLLYLLYIPHIFLSLHVWIIVIVVLVPLCQAVFFPGKKFGGFLGIGGKVRVGDPGVWAGPQLQEMSWENTGWKYVHNIYIYIYIWDLPSPTQDASGKWRFSSKNSQAWKCFIICVVTGTGWGVDPFIYCFCLYHDVDYHDIFFQHERRVYVF